MPPCASCGSPNPAAAKFCAECGAPLGRPTEPGVEERKVISVLFCDLVGFTARSDNADPEDVRAALAPYSRRLRTEIERFGGTVEKFIGDAVMAVFGAPVVHEDDAERAVRAGLRLLDAVAELDRELSMDLAVRVGIATGEAVVAVGARPERGEGFVTGDVVNTASRLQGVAPPGGLVVGEGTWRTTRAIVDYEPLPAVTVKGKAAPLRIWRAIAARSRFGTDLTQASTPFVAREDELTVLRNAYSRALREGSTQLVTVVGEPGVGKTRLVGEFFHWIDGRDELVVWRQGRCLPYGEGIAFWALGEIVKAHAGILETDGPQVARDKLAEAVEAVVEPADRDWVTARLAPIVGLPDPGRAERVENFTAWLRLLEGIAERSPLVLVVEDLHWADPALLEFLGHVTDWATGVPLMLVCTARPELYERAPGWAGGKRNISTIGLGTLSDEETARLLAGLLGTAVLPADVQAVLLERAGGNPLYAQEFARMLLDRGLLDGDGRPRLEAGDLAGAPDSVQALIAARLDLLPAEHKRLLQDAAVIGKLFWSGAVATLGGLDEAAVRGPLHELVRRELLRPARRSSVPGQAEYAFTHALIRDVAYGSLPRAARVRKHQTAGGWVQALTEERSDSTDVVAYHLTTALDLARVAGDVATATALTEPATRALIAAGDRAMSLDVAAAARHYDRALGLLAAEYDERPGLLLKAGMAVSSESEDRGLALFAEATAGFDRRGDALGGGMARLRASEVLRWRGERARHDELLAEAIALLERAPPGLQLARAYGSAAFDAGQLGRHEDAIRLATAALAAPDGDSDAHCWALNNRGASRLALGDPAGVEDMRTALVAVTRAGVIGTIASTRDNLAEAAWVTENPQCAIAEYAAIIDFAQQRGFRNMAVGEGSLSVPALFDAGDWDRLSDLVDESAAWYQARSGGYFDVLQQPYRAAVRSWRGDASTAEAVIEEYLPQARNIGHFQVLVPSLAVGALVRLRRYRPADALGLLTELADLVPAEAEWYRCMQLPVAVRTALAAGDQPLASRLVDGLDPKLRRNRLCYDAALAAVAEARGDLDDAIARYDEVAVGWAAYGHVLEHGLALLGAGRCRLRRGKAAGAERLQAARELFVVLGASTAIAELDALLPRQVASQQGSDAK